MSSLRRDRGWIATAEQTERYFEKNNFPPTEALINYQANFSGLELMVGKDRRGLFKAELFTKSRILNNSPISANEDYFLEGEKFYFNCGTHATAQFQFYISDVGEICTDLDDDIINVLYSSFEKKIEQYALRNEIQNWQEDPVYYEIENQLSLEKYMEQGFDLIEECSDAYNSWWGNKDLIIANSTWLDRKEKYFHIYGKKLDYCKLLIEEFKNQRILK